MVLRPADALEDAAAIDTEPRHQAAARRYRDLAHERESALKCGRVAVVDVAAVAQQREELRMCAREPPLHDPAWPWCAKTGVSRA